MRVIKTLKALKLDEANHQPSPPTYGLQALLDEANHQPSPPTYGLQALLDEAKPSTFPPHLWTAGTAG